MPYKDIFGKHWGGIKKKDICPVCGQPNLLGPCDHKEMDEARKVKMIVAMLERQPAPKPKRRVKVRRIYYNVTSQHWDMVSFDKEDCDEYQSNKGAIAHAVELIRRGIPFVFVPYDPDGFVPRTDLE